MTEEEAKTKIRDTLDGVFDTAKEGNVDPVWLIGALEMMQGAIVTAKLDGTLG